MELADGRGAAQPAGDGAARVSTSQPAEGGGLLSYAKAILPLRSTEGCLPLSLGVALSFSRARARSVCLSRSSMLYSYSQQQQLAPVCTQMHVACAFVSTSLTYFSPLPMFRCPGCLAGFPLITLITFRRGSRSRYSDGAALRKRNV